MPDQSAEPYTPEQLARAATLVVSNQFASTSFIARHMNVPGATANAIMNDLERRKVVGPANGTRARQVLQPSFAVAHVVRDIRSDAVWRRTGGPAAGRDLVDPDQLRAAERIVYSAIPLDAVGINHADLARSIVGLLADAGWVPTRSTGT